MCIPISPHGYLFDSSFILYSLHQAPGYTAFFSRVVLLLVQVGPAQDWGSLDG